MVPPILLKYLKGATNQETKISKIKFLIVKKILLNNLFFNISFRTIVDPL